MPGPLRPLSAPELGPSLHQAAGGPWEGTSLLYLPRKWSGRAQADEWDLDYQLPPGLCGPHHPCPAQRAWAWHGEWHPEDGLLVAPHTVGPRNPPRSSPLAACPRPTLKTLEPTHPQRLTREPRPFPVSCSVEEAGESRGLHRPGLTLRTPARPGHLTPSLDFMAGWVAPPTPKVSHPLANLTPTLQELPGLISSAGASRLGFLLRGPSPSQEAVCPQPHHRSPQPTTPTLGIHGKDTPAFHPKVLLPLTPQETAFHFLKFYLNVDY